MALGHLAQPFHVFLSPCPFSHSSIFYFIFLYFQSFKLHFTILVYLLQFSQFCPLVLRRSLMHPVGLLFFFFSFSLFFLLTLTGATKLPFNNFVAERSQQRDDQLPAPSVPIPLELFQAICDQTLSSDQLLKSDQNQNDWVFGRSQFDAQQIQRGKQPMLMEEPSMPRENTLESLIGNRGNAKMPEWRPIQGPMVPVQINGPLAENMPMMNQMGQLDNLAMSKKVAKEVQRRPNFVNENLRIRLDGQNRGMGMNMSMVDPFPGGSNLGSPNTMDSPGSKRKGQIVEDPMDFMAKTPRAEEPGTFVARKQQNYGVMEAQQWAAQQQFEQKMAAQQFEQQQLEQHLRQHEVRQQHILGKHPEQHGLGQQLLRKHSEQHNIAQKQLGEHAAQHAQQWSLAHEVAQQMQLRQEVYRQWQQLRRSETAQHQQPRIPDMSGALLQRLQQQNQTKAIQQQPIRIEQFEHAQQQQQQQQQQQHLLQRTMGHAVQMLDLVNLGIGISLKHIPGMDLTILDTQNPPFYRVAASLIGTYLLKFRPMTGLFIDLIGKIKSSIAGPEMRIVEILEGIFMQIYGKQKELLEELSRNGNNNGRLEMEKRLLNLKLYKELYEILDKILGKEVESALDGCEQMARRWRNAKLFLEINLNEYYGRIGKEMREMERGREEKEGLRMRMAMLGRTQPAEGSQRHDVVEGEQPQPSSVTIPYRSQHMGIVSHDHHQVFHGSDQRFANPDHSADLDLTSSPASNPADFDVPPGFEPLPVPPPSAQPVDSDATFSSAADRDPAHFADTLHGVYLSGISRAEPDQLSDNTDGPGTETSSKIGKEMNKTEGQVEANGKGKRLINEKKGSEGEGGKVKGQGKDDGPNGEEGGNEDREESRTVQEQNQVSPNKEEEEKDQLGKIKDDEWIEEEADQMMNRNESDQLKKEFDQKDLEAIGSDQLEETDQLMSRKELDEVKHVMMAQSAADEAHAVEETLDEQQPAHSAVGNENKREKNQVEGEQSVENGDGQGEEGVQKKNNRSRKGGQKPKGHQKGQEQKGQGTQKAHVAEGQQVGEVQERKGEEEELKQPRWPRRERRPPKRLIDPDYLYPVWELQQQISSEERGEPAGGSSGAAPNGPKNEK